MKVKFKMIKSPMPIFRLIKVAGNVLRAGEVFYFGLFVALSCRQKYCNKVTQISTLKYIAIFFLAGISSELQT